MESRIRAEDKPRAIIEKAIQAVGGLEKVTQPRAVYRKMKGTLWLTDHSPLSAEYYTEKGSRSRLALRWQQHRQAMSVLRVSDGTHQWVRYNDVTQELDKETQAQTKKSRYGDRVTSLVPLLKDKSFTLTLLPESKVEGKAALGIKVAAKDQQDILFYFDKVSGVLVKAVHKEFTAGGKEGGTLTVEYQDYRDEEPRPGLAEEDALKKARLATDTTSLLNYLRKHILSPANLEEIKALVRRLGDRSYRVRQQASAALIARGAPALRFLRQATRDADLEIAVRAKKCLRQIREGPGIELVAHTVRLLGVRRHPGSARVLLDYLPFATNDRVDHEVRSALYAIGSAPGKPDPVLVEALERKDPERRAAAAAALGRDGGAYRRLPGRRVYIPGLKGARKHVYYQQGKKIMELETTEVQFFNTFEDKLFAKPE
jgi:hypothetical protein